MILSSNTTDFASGTLGMVELVLSYLNDRQAKYWSKAEVIEYLNQAQLQIANKINQLYETYFITSATTPTVANQTKYSLPADLVQLMGIEIADSVADDEPKDLIEIHYTDRKFYQKLSDINQKDRFGFFFVTGTDLSLEPHDTSANHQLRTYYVKRLAALVADADVSEIPAEHHEVICVSAARRGRMKLGRENPGLNVMYLELLDDLSKTIRRFSPQRDEQALAFWGTQGPIPPITGRTS